MNIGKVLRLLDFSFKESVPMILQTEVTECGLACIAMIANYHGYKTNLLSLRRKFPISLKGSNLRELSLIADHLNLIPRALKLEISELRNLKKPCILHWDLDHFVVLKEVNNKTVVIHDPAIGVVKYSLTDVSKHFTGIAMELLPSTDFTTKNDEADIKLFDLWSSVIGIKSSLVQILCISTALEIFAIIVPLFMQLVTDSVVVANDLPLLYILAIGFGIIIVTQSFTSYIRSWSIVFLSNTLNIQLVANLMHHLFKLPLDFFEKRHMGDIVSRFDSIKSIQEKISTDFVTAMVDGFMVIITLIVMIVYSGILTAIILTALLFYILVRLIFYPKMKLQTQESIVKSAKEQSVFMEGIRSILPLKIFGKELQRENLWQNCYADRLNADIRLSKLNLLYQLLMQLIFGIEYIVTILLGAKLVINNGAFSIGMLIAYLSYRQQFTSKAQNLIEKLIEYRMIKIHLERVADIALTKTEEKKPEETKKHIIEGKIAVNGLSFRYSEREEYIFKKLSFNVKAGEILAIKGPSGCGKTTLFKVLLRLLKPSEGSIFIDDVDVNQIDLRNYRSQVAAVMQEDNLLSGSIAENISFFDQTPDYNKIYMCAQIAAIHEQITQMPMSYNSLVGDMGAALSGGQKQRILLARALYAQPKILFLDEATSHLDITNETIINEHIKQLGITRIIAAHREETIKIADHIVDLGKLKTEAS